MQGDRETDAERQRDRCRETEQGWLGGKERVAEKGVGGAGGGPAEKEGEKEGGYIL